MIKIIFLLRELLIFPTEKYEQLLGEKLRIIPWKKIGQYMIRLKNYGLLKFFLMN
jgi:hypothetical protein